MTTDEVDTLIISVLRLDGPYVSFAKLQDKLSHLSTTGLEMGLNRLKRKGEVKTVITIKDTRNNLATAGILEYYYVPNYRKRDTDDKQ